MSFLHPKYLSFLASCGLVYLFFGVLSSQMRLLHESGPRIVTGWGLLLAVVVTAGSLVAMQRLKQHRSDLHRGGVCVEDVGPCGWFSFHALVVGLFVYLLSDMMDHSYMFFIDNRARTEIFYLGLLGSFLGYWVCAPSLGRALLGGGSRVFCVGLLLFQLLLVSLFAKHVGKQLIFSDDHPSFLYRIRLLLDHFPNVPFYSTDWNAGYWAKEFFATGALNIFVLSYPWLKLFSSMTDLNSFWHYSYLLPYFFIFLIPWSVYLATRLLGFSCVAGVLAAFFSLVPNHMFFEYLLKYGTLGFCISAGLVPLTLVLVSRLSCLSPKVSATELVTAVLVSSCCLAWTISILVFIPVTLLAIWWLLRSFSSSRAKFVCLFVALFLLLNGWWLKTFVVQSRVVDFISAAGEHGKTAPPVHSRALSEKHGGNKDSGNKTGELASWVSKAHRTFKQASSRMNPLLLLLFLPGLLLVSDRRMRIVLSATLCWLILLGAVGDIFRPQLELRRMFIIAGFLLAVLAGAGTEWVLVQLGTQLADVKRPIIQRIYCLSSIVVIVGCVLMTPVVATASYLNRSVERYVFAPDSLARLAEAIDAHGGPGRTFFLGFLLHELGSNNSHAPNGGHIAPLALLTQKELYAYYFYHKYWVSIDPIPKNFRRRGGPGIEEYLDLVNATAVVTFRKFWREYCMAHPERYELVRREGRFYLFIRKPDAPGYFLKGSGEIIRETRSISLQLPSGQDEVVIKYRYFPFLSVGRSDDDRPSQAELFPYPVARQHVGGEIRDDIELIGVRPNGETRIVIK